MFFDLDLRPVADIHRLAGLLARLEPDPLAFVIRGVPKPGIGQGARVRRKKKPDVRTGQEPHFTDAEAGLSWVMLDKVPAPASIDPINDPEEAVLWLVGLLPAEFQDVTFYWQASASAGMGDGRTLSAHVWFWLGRNVTDAELTAWSEGHDLPVDVSLFRTVQPHWTAAPIFEDVRDPLPRRSGLWCGLEDAVDFPPVEVRPRRSCTNGEAAGAGLRLGEARGFEAKLALLGDRDGYGRPGFHRVLLSATSSHAATHGRARTDVAALRARIREAIEAAPKSPQRTKDEIEGSGP